MRDDRPERFRSTPYHKEQAGGRRGAKEEERKRAYWLRFWRGARLWRLQVSCKRGICRDSDLQEEEKVPSCETLVDAMTTEQHDKRPAPCQSSAMALPNVVLFSFVFFCFSPHSLRLRHSFTVTDRHDFLLDSGATGDGRVNQ